MASEYDRDNWLAHLVRRSAGDAAPVSACLEAETLAAWYEGGLAPAERAAVEAHAADCSRCMALIAAIERTTPPLVPQQSRRAWIRWAVPLAAAATAVAIWVAIPGQQVSPVQELARSEQSQTSQQRSAPEEIQVAPPAAPPPAPAPKAEVEKPQFAPEVPLRRRENQSADTSTREMASPEAPPPAAAPAPQPAGAAAPAPPPQGTAASQARSADAAAERSAALEQTLMSARSPVLEAQAAADSDIRWRVVSGASVERSTDGGATWTRTASPVDPGPGNTPTVTIVEIRAESAMDASLTTSDGRTFVTTDGGKSWMLARQ